MRDVVIRGCGWAFVIFLVPVAIPAVASSISPHQQEPVGCAVRAVRPVLLLLDQDVADEAIREAFAGRLSGSHSYHDIAEAAESLGLHMCFVEVDPSSPRFSPLPLIGAVKRTAASTRPDHFVVFYGGDGESVQVLDFPRSPYTVRSSMLARAWDGRGLYVAVNEEDLPECFPPSWACCVVLASALAVAVTSLRVWARTPRPRGE